VSVVGFSFDGESEGSQVHEVHTPERNFSTKVEVKRYVEIHASQIRKSPDSPERFGRSYCGRTADGTE